MLLKKSKNPSSLKKKKKKKKNQKKNKQTKFKFKVQYIMVYGKTPRCLPYAKAYHPHIDRNTYYNYVIMLFRVINLPGSKQRRCSNIITSRREEGRKRSRSDSHIVTLFRKLQPLDKRIIVINQKTSKTKMKLQKRLFLYCILSCNLF